MISQKRQLQFEGLSERAVDILRLLKEGLSDREIAERLTLTINTVKWYNRQIYGVLGVGSRTQAIARANDLQLLESDTDAAPALHIVRRTPENNLPLESTHFIGRSRIIDDLKQLLDNTRLLTLVGTPGTGKTRLALQIAREMMNSFKDGVYFVTLAQISDAALVTNAIASAVGVNPTPSKPLLDTLKLFLRESQMLLILDNFEHLLAASTQVSELLASAPRLKVLTTSREPLHLYGEQEYAVPPLELPEADTLDLQTLAGCESTALFVQQARAVRSDFELTEENVDDVAQICLRLEGLPLAIELAAARIKLLTPRALLARLSSPLDTLTGGAHDLPARQRTLRNTIAWSYDLLDDAEKILFARLAVFRGGCPLDAIEAVCGNDLAMDVFDGIASLVDKSLLQHTEMVAGAPRFVMLETIHEYAWEQLRASGEAPTIQRRHAEYFLQMAQHAEPELRQAGFAHWMQRLSADEDNLRVALDWALDNNDTELGVTLVVLLRDFWVMSGRFEQGQYWTRRALELADSVPPNLRVRVFTAAGVLLYISSQRDLQKNLFDDAAALARKIDDKLNLAWALCFTAAACIRYGTDYEDGLTVIEESLALFRQLNHKTGIVQALNITGELWRVAGDDKLAQAAYEECLALVSETGEVRREVMMLCNLGFIAMHRSDTQAAQNLFSKGLLKSQELGHDKRLTISCIIFLAGAHAAHGDYERAARLFGAADALFKPAGVGLSPSDQPEQARYLTLARAQLGDENFQMCWDEGRELSLEQAVSYAIDDD